MAKRKIRIGFIINDASADYCKELIIGVNEACETHDCILLIFPVGEFGMCYNQFGYQSRAIAAFANKHNLDGLIIATSTQGTHVTNDVLFDYVHSFNDLPVVSIGVDVPNVPSVLVDCKPGLYSMVSHLIEVHKCKKIALISAGENSIEAEERTEVFKQALEDHNMQFDKTNVFYGFFTYALAQKALADHIQEKGSLNYDAIVCLNDIMAYGVIDFCKQNKIAVPKKICVTGFDDIVKTAISTPTISTVNQQMEKQGNEAVEIIFKIIQKKTIPHIQRIPTKVRYRQTCGCVALEDGFSNYKTENFETVTREQENPGGNGAEWFIRKDQLLRIEHYYADTQTKINLHQFIGQFQFVLNDFGIDAAAICIYNEPVVQSSIFTHFELPNKARVLAAYDNFEHYNYKSDADTKIFNPNDEILPEEYFRFTGGKYFVIALSHCEFQYGYLIFKPGSYDETMYEFITTILASQLSVAIEYSKDEEEKQKLNTNNQILKKISRTDDLTNLLNRRGFMELGQDAIDLAIKCRQSGLVVFGDMDDLKKINDNYGHDSGDRAIKAEAELLKKVFRSTDVIGRLGGDEFAIVASGMNIKKFQKIKDRLEKICTEWNKISGEQFTLSISLGFANFDLNNCALTVLLQEADAKQYQEKRRKKLTKKENGKR